MRAAAAGARGVAHVAALAAALAGVLLGAGCPQGCGSLKPSCRRAVDCRRDGRCATSWQRTGDSFTRCYPAAEADCARSTACRDEGRCHLAPGLDPTRCVALRPADCLGSSGCRDLGRCTLTAEGTCVPSFAGCTRAAAGRCEDANGGPFLAPDLRPGDCERACRAEGACTRAGAECRATDAAACRAADACRTHGRCALDAAAHVCVAATDADCAAAEVCRDPGAAGGRCAVVPGGAFCADPRPYCARQDGCALHGWCTLEEGVCVAAREEECAGSLACRVSGDCALVKHDFCRPRRASDCRRSLECRAFGRCDALRLPWPYGGPPYCGKPGETLRPYGCLGDDCLERGRCLRADDDRCVTPREAGLDEDLALPTGAATGRRPRRGSTTARSTTATASAATAPSPASAPTRPGPAPASRPAPPDEPPPHTPLVVALDGRPLPVRDAIAGTHGGEALFVILSDRRLDCRALGLGWQPLGRDETRIELTVAERIGERGQRVVGASWPHGMAGDSGTAEAPPGLGRAGGRGRLAVRVRAEFALRGATLDARGAITVRGCGDFPPPGGRRTQAGLVATVDGRPLHFAGATLHSAGPGIYRLTLTSAPLACPPRQYAVADEEITVHFGPGGVQQVTVGGVRRRAIGVGGLPVHARLIAAEGGPAEVALDVDTTAGRGRRLVLRGTAVAERCR